MSATATVHDDGTVSVAGLAAVPVAVGVLLEVAIEGMRERQSGLSREEAIFEIRQRCSDLLTD